MTVVAPPLTYRPYRAPQRDVTALCEPPLAGARQMLRDGQRRASQWDVELAGRPLGELRQQARRDLIERAAAYTASYRDTPAVLGAAASQAPVILAGHQPELFHPGVWFKNFVLSRLGQSTGATAINLIVDNDLNRAVSVRVPTRRGGRVMVTPVLIDRLRGGVPLEQHFVEDRAMFHSFDRRVAEAVAPLVANPLVRELWPYAREAVRRCGNIGCGLAQARHQLEADLGLSTLEVPLSNLCRSESFAAFVLGILAELPRFQEVYNESVRHYRAAHGIRSHAHPVPELSESAGWLEAPLWMYSDAAPQRRGVFVRQRNDVLELTDRRDTRLVLDVPPDDARAPHRLLEQLAASGIKLRPRALTTTMFARLLLGDLFLHGIGGGKYDQLNDRLIQRFFGIEPPEYAVLSATVLLPGAPDREAATAQVRQARHRLRDTTFHPECFELTGKLPHELVRAKHQLLADIPPRGRKKAWHERVVQLNAQMAEHLDEVRIAAVDRLRTAEAQAREAELLSSREHPFCIYPLEYLRDRLSRLAEQVTSG